MLHCRNVSSPFCYWHCLKCNPWFQWKTRLPLLTSHTLTSDQTIWQGICLSVWYLENSSFNLLHTWQVCSRGPEGSAVLKLVQFGHAGAGLTCDPSYVISWGSRPKPRLKGCSVFVAWPRVAPLFACFEWGFFCCFVKAVVDNSRERWLVI